MLSSLGIAFIYIFWVTGPPQAEGFGGECFAPQAFGGHRFAVCGRFSGVHQSRWRSGAASSGLHKLYMGRIPGNSGYSRSAQEPREQDFSGSKAMARPNLIHTPEIVGPGYKMKEADLVDPATGKRRKWLSVFDFDGTLFRAPIRFFKNGQIDPPNAGLKPPQIPKNPGSEWFDQDVVKAARDRAASEDHTAVLLSERPHIMKERIEELCAGQGMEFDKVVLRPDGKHTESASEFKSKWVRKFLKHLRIAEGKATRAEVWDDSAECRYEMGRIEGVSVHAVLGRYGPPMEVGGNVKGYAPPDSSRFPGEASGKEGGAEDTPFMYGYALSQGRRDYMEDRCVAKKIRTADGGVGHIFAVFDGHGGCEAANWASSRVWKSVEDNLVDGHSPEEALRTAFLKVDEDWCEHARKNGNDDSGSTGLVVLVVGGSVWCASAGDGSAVVYRKGGAGPEVLSTAHKPDSKEEEKRIKNLGGKVVYRDCARLEGVLAVSRGFGDLSLKKWVTAEPAIQRWDVTSTCSTLVISSDGMTDVLVNAEVQNIVDTYPNVEEAAKELVDVSLAEGTTDNLGIIVLDLAGVFKSATAAAPQHVQKVPVYSIANAASSSTAFRRQSQLDDGPMLV